MPSDFKFEVQQISLSVPLLKLAPTAAQPAIALGPAHVLAFLVSGRLPDTKAFRGQVQIAAGPARPNTPMGSESAAEGSGTVAQVSYTVALESSRDHPTTGQLQENQVRMSPLSILDQPIHSGPAFFTQIGRITSSLATTSCVDRGGRLNEPNRVQPVRGWSISEQ